MSERMSDTLRLIINFALVVVTIVSVSFAVIKSNDADKIQEVKEDVVRHGVKIDENERSITLLQKSYAVIENELKHISNTQAQILEEIKEYKNGR